MTSMVARAINLRDECDSSITTKQSPQRMSIPSSTDSKARFMIRTLPRDCNPTPPASGGDPGGMTSPRGRKPSLSSVQESEEPAENPFDDITEQTLQKLTGQQDLSRVTNLTLSVDSANQSIEVIGELLPSLQQLRLYKSTLVSFRDLGTSLRSLQTLDVSDCGIHDLDGISALTGLQHLHVQRNEISDISPLTMHEEIQSIDLEGNCISDVGQIEQLAFCPQLTSLNLEANPVCRIQLYRQIVANFVPQLQILDHKAITNEERHKLSDTVIDDVIRAFTLAEQARVLALEPPPLTSRPPSSHGSQRDSDPMNYGPGLLRNSSASQLPLQLDSADYGSTLTHGSDIVFAGNVTSALRRHRSGTEGDAHSPRKQSLQPSLPVYTTPDTRTCERPKTPARESITATLDRAHELEHHKHKSRDTILSELRAWQRESAGSTQIGVVSMEQEEELLSKSTTKSRSKSSMEKRPNTSAGVLRNGKGVREAFVVSQSVAKHDTDTPLVKRHSSASSSTTTRTSPQTVDILVLDEPTPTQEPQQHQQELDPSDGRPCSARKSSRGVFTMSNTTAADWDLSDIAPTLDLEATESFIQRKTRRSSSSSLTTTVGKGKSRPDYDRRHMSPTTGEEEDESSDSGSEDLHSRDVARQLKQRKQHSSSPASTKTKGFFNVVESLHAIDRWREQMDTEPATLSIPVANPTTPDERGPACHASNEQIVEWMKTKHKMVAEIKTRDGFRRFFKGIQEERLKCILEQVFTDSDKVQRRIQLMQGYLG